jgi:ABC-type transporter Mla subunit MlaD
MKLMIADAPCYVNDTLYKPGDEFEYDGPEGMAFHEKGKEKKTPVSVDRLIEAAAAKASAGDSPDLAALKAKVAALDKQLASTLKNAGKLADELADRDAALKDAAKRIEELTKQLEELTAPKK